jgi:16S rRNA (uracil1498-N3)-methyltransferase
VVDGKGHAFQVRLETVSKANVAGEVISEDAASAELGISITLALGLLKNRSKVELVVEKATELGVTGVIPLETERSERSSIRIDRLEAIAVAAMKQSGRAVKPVIHTQADFRTVVDSFQADARIICHESSSGKVPPIDKLAGLSVLLMIGPEGGFSDEELKIARGAGFLEWYLGARRLRAETAAIASISALAMWSEGVHP